jgi:hypothetical protein
MNAKNKVLLPLVSLFFLASCTNGGTSIASTGGNGGGGYTPVTQSSAAPSVSSKQKVINYLKSNGSYSNGEYMLGGSSTSTSDGYTFQQTLYFSYSPSEDKFNLVGEMIGTKSGSSLEVTWLGGATFYWGSYKSGTFLSDYEAGSYQAIYSLNTITFASDNEISACHYHQEKYTFSDSFDFDTIKSGLELATKEFNKAVTYYNSFSLPALA